LFQIEDFPDIVYHLQTTSKIFKLLPNHEYYEMFCPYCDDAIRKLNPSHGHMNIGRRKPFFNCFRCDSKGSLLKLLKDGGFSNIDVLRKLASLKTDYVFTSSSKSLIKQKKIPIQSIHREFRSNNPQYYDVFQRYLYTRILDGSALEHFLYPDVYDNKLRCTFSNYNGNIVTSRFISPSKIRYMNATNKQYYFFQDIGKIDEFESIVICEGAFDAINLYHYSIFNTKNNFFLAINGKYYTKVVKELITNFLLIGKHNFKIVFDADILNTNQIKFSITQVMNQLNPECTAEYYKPILTKDVSELMNIDKT
jgi:hypothetical protein